MTTNDKGEVVVTYTDGTSEILGTLAGSKGDQGAPGRDGFDGAPGRDGTDGQNGKDGKDGRGIKSVTTDADGNLVINYTDGTTETVKTGDKPVAPAGSSVSERCLPTVLGLAIPATLAIPLAFLGNASALFNIPGLEPVRKQIESLTHNITRGIPREAQYAAGGIGLLAALGIIAAACAPTESE
ncbi:collagen-like protein [Corynebacterium hiratae]|uniref:collagen-like protein n=1 Tax=Corynebacterium hiratae TaxID=3139423 RepID=UPI001E2F6632|nr:collagen-like protein [Corynebacterium aurimucosum]